MFIRLLGILLLLIPLSTPLLAATASAPQADTGHTVYLPLIAKLSSVRAVMTGRSWTKGGSGIVYGEVINQSGSPVYNVTIEAQCYDPTGLLLSMHKGSRDVAFPGDPNPFTVFTEPCRPSTPEYRVVVDVVGFAMSSPVAYKRLPIVSQQRQDFGISRSVVSGEVRNDQAETLTNVRVELAWTGGVGFVWVFPSTLAPGETGSFSSAGNDYLDIEPYDLVKMQARGKVAP